MFWQRLRSGDLEGHILGFYCAQAPPRGIEIVKRLQGLLLLEEGKSPQNGTERVSVTSAKTFFSLKDWAKMKSESSIIYVTMEKKHSGQAPTLGL